MIRELQNVLLILVFLETQCHTSPRLLLWFLPWNTQSESLTQVAEDSIEKSFVLDPCIIIRTIWIFQKVLAWLSSMQVSIPSFQLLANLSFEKLYTSFLASESYLFEFSKLCVLDCFVSIFKLIFFRNDRLDFSLQGLNRKSPTCRGVFHWKDCPFRCLCRNPNSPRLPTSFWYQLLLYPSFSVLQQIEVSSRKVFARTIRALNPILTVCQEAPFRLIFLDVEVPFFLKLLADFLFEVSSDSLLLQENYSILNLFDSVHPSQSWNAEKCQELLISVFQLFPPELPFSSAMKISVDLF